MADKLQWSAAMLQKALPTLWRMSTLVVPRLTVQAVPNDPDDNRILECAVAVNAHFLVTGDRDLLALQKYKSISIVTPREFIEANFGQ